MHTTAGYIFFYLYMPLRNWQKVQNGCRAVPSFILRVTATARAREQETSVQCLFIRPLCSSDCLKFTAASAKGGLRRMVHCFLCKCAELFVQRVEAQCKTLSDIHGISSCPQIQAVKTKKEAQSPVVKTFLLQKMNGDGTPYRSVLLSRKAIE